MLIAYACNAPVYATYVALATLLECYFTMYNGYILGLMYFN